MAARHAVPNLADDTRRRYLEVWGAHLLDRLGGFELCQITSLVVEDLRDQMTRARVPAPTQRKTLMLLQGILRRAVVRGLIPANPVQLVTKPKQKPTSTPQPLSPLTASAASCSSLADESCPRPTRDSAVGAHTRRLLAARRTAGATL